MKRTHGDGGSCHTFRVSRSQDMLRVIAMILLYLSIARAAGEVSTSGSSSIPRNVVPLTGRDTPRVAYRHAAKSSAVVTDEFLTFCVDFDGLPEQLASSRDYRVVAVTGCQCSGKSTLLNALFGSMFPVLEHSPDALPRRTTIGAWIDLQLCSIPRKKKEKAEAEQKRSTGGSPLGPSTTERAGVGGAATLPTRKVDASFAVRDTRTLGEEATEALAPQGSEVPTAPFVLVDVEGTQSRDRGGAEGVEFDSRTTLFAVMAADVIMLNLWAHDVGRADGLAYTVLRSVLEEAARLLQEGRDLDTMRNAPQRGRGSRSSSAAEAERFPKVLMLVLRDVEEEDHLEVLEKAVRANMEAIWRDVDKPRSLRDASLSEVFDLRTSGLPHFNYQRRQFATKAASMSRSFVDPNHPDFVFAREQFRDGECREQDGYLEGAGERIVDAYKRDLQAAVPLSRLPERLQGIWASASINDHLSEAPRRSEQQGAVAVARIAELCVSEARAECARLLLDVEGAARGVMPLLQFGSDAKGIVDRALRSFQMKTSRAQPPIDAPPLVVRRKRRWLVGAVARELEPAFRAHVQHLRVHFHDQFEEAFSCVLGGASDFEVSWRTMAKSAKANFLGATKLAIPDTAGVGEVWRLHWEAELVKLNEDIEARVQDRLSEGTWMLAPGPEELAATGAKKMPWWKSLILRAAVMYFNYLQATQHLRQARRASEKRERDVPRLPLF